MVHFVGCERHAYLTRTSAFFLMKDLTLNVNILEIQKVVAVIKFYLVNILDSSLYRTALKFNFLYVFYLLLAYIFRIVAMSKYNVPNISLAIIRNFLHG